MVLEAGEFKQAVLDRCCHENTGMQSSPKGEHGAVCGVERKPLSSHLLQLRDLPLEIHPHCVLLFPSMENRGGQKQCVENVKRIKVSTQENKFNSELLLINTHCWLINKLINVRQMFSKI